jgi:hypothetical protein
MAQQMPALNRRSLARCSYGLYGTCSVLASIRRLNFAWRSAVTADKIGDMLALTMAENAACPQAGPGRRAI